MTNQFLSHTSAPTAPPSGTVGSPIPEHRFRMLLEMLHEGVVYQDRQGTVIYINPAAELILGNRAGELPGTTSLHHENDCIREDGTPLPAADHPAAVALATGVPQRNVVMGVFNQKEGLYRWISVHSTPVFAPGATEPVEVCTSFTDITERVEKERALRESEERFRSFVEASAQMVWAVDPKKGFTYGAAAWAEFTGQPVDQVDGAGYLEAVHPEDIGRVIDTWRRCITRGTMLEVEYRVRRHDGQWRYISGRGVPVFDPNGEVREVVGTSIDITERKEAEAARRLSEERFSTIFDAAHFGIGLVTLPDGRIIDMNHAGLELFGLTKDEVIGRTAVELGISADPEARERMLQEVREKGVIRNFESHYRTKDGTPIIVSLNMNLIRLGNELHTLVCLENITERKRTEEALQHARGELEARVVERTEALSITVEALNAEIAQRRETEEVLRKSEAMLKTVLETIPVAVFITSAEGRVVFHNQSAFDMWGGILDVGTEGFASYKGWWPDTGVALKAGDWGCGKALLRGETTLGQIVEIETFDGLQRKTVVNSAAPIRGADGDIIGCVGIVDDITRERELQRQLLHAQKLESIGALAGGVAHDFNNILTVICGFTELVFDELTDEAMRGNLRQVLTAGESARDLAQKLLVFSRQQVTEKTVLNLSEKVADMLRFVSRLIPEDIEVREELAGQEIVIRGSSVQIDQVLMNILLNARDAMECGGTLTVATGETELSSSDAARMGLEEEGTFGYVKISDTGCGIRKTDLGRIFEPYFTTKETGKGTGLGLAIAYGIVRQHKGAISVETTEGRGTTFTLYFPLTEDRLQETDDVEAFMPAGGFETVLLVEDDHGVLAFLQKALEQAGYQVLTASDAEEALRIVTAAQIDLVLTDVIMPGMSGIDMYRKMKEVMPDIRLIIASGYSPVVVNGNSIEDDFRFLQKPVSRKALLRAVREMLDG